jgi:hypothetical protein
MPIAFEDREEFVIFYVDLRDISVLQFLLLLHRQPIVDLKIQLTSESIILNLCFRIMVPDYLIRAQLFC